MDKKENEKEKNKHWKCEREINEFFAEIEVKSREKKRTQIYSMSLVDFKVIQWTALLA